MSKMAAMPIHCLRHIGIQLRDVLAYVLSCVICIVAYHNSPTSKSSVTC